MVGGVLCSVVKGVRDDDDDDDVMEMIWDEIFFYCVVIIDFLY